HRDPFADLNEFEIEVISQPPIELLEILCGTLTANLKAKPNDLRSLILETYIDLFGMHHGDKSTPDINAAVTHLRAAYSKFCAEGLQSNKLNGEGVIIETALWLLHRHVRELQLSQIATAVFNSSPANLGPRH
ncbi:MAG: hypothetical protein IPG93_04345, partial [Burkholderiales bacterium]|nr:hypothetical protein [Burkholderiales bacterium]